jgi:LmbE family N-acetylglucosaminyl deacetylase
MRRPSNPAMRAPRKRLTRRAVNHWIEIIFSAGLPAVVALCPPPPLAAQSAPEAVEAIDKARVTTRVLFITAHPDDEASSLLTYLSRGLDDDVALLTITRGQGGQNSIGPEQGAELGMLRTSELLAASQHNGVRQFFTRAPDFGYSKSAEQTLKIWGDVPLEDMVRVLRTFRPEIVINGWGGVHWGHGQHQASGILTPQAVAAAADPNKFSAQIQEGLAPWKVSSVLDDSRDDAPSDYQVPLNSVLPLWGKTSNEWGRESLAFHRSQGVSNFLDSPFFRRPLYLIVEGEKNASKLDTSVLAQPLPALASGFPSFRSLMAPGLKEADNNLDAARKAMLNLDRASAAKDLAQAGAEILGLKKQLEGQSGRERAEAIWQLDRVSDRIDHALAEVVALPVRVRADRNELVAGESFTVSVGSPGPPAVPVKWGLPKDGLILPAGWNAVSDGADQESGDIRFKVSIPRDAKPPGSPGDAILPWPPPLVQASVDVGVDNYQFTLKEPAVAVRASSTSVDTYPLELVPAVTLTVNQQHVMYPVQSSADDAPAPIALLARVRYHGTSAAKVAVGVDAPEGWKVSPTAPLDFSSPGDQLVVFHVTPPAHPKAGEYILKPNARLGAETFRTSLEPLSSLPTRSWGEPANATVNVLDLKISTSLHVGYITAGTDPIPEILRQLGIRVDLLDEVALAFGDLSHYDSIVVGIRAYELRSDLPRANARLREYVKSGGTLVVQYQRDFAWAKFLPAPFPATMGQPAARVTDPNSPVHSLAPENPLLNSPNKITMDDFQGWVQERGLYFWGKFDSRYQPVLGLRDPGEDEATGGLVYARDEKGVYIYTGLSFFRELPAGVPGAYRLFINLLSQSRLEHPKD